MDQEDLRQFFGKMLKDEGYISSESFAVFGKLIRLTIQYRDRLLATENVTLTVDETKRGIAVYLDALRTGSLAEDIEPKIDGLVRLWLKEINHITF
jgi:hypothetical protein